MHVSRNARARHVEFSFLTESRLAGVGFGRTQVQLFLQVVVDQLDLLFEGRLQAFVFAQFAKFRPERSRVRGVAGAGRRVEEQSFYLWEEHKTKVGATTDT